MNTAKRPLALLLALVLALSLFAGCSSGTGDSGSGTSASPGTGASTSAEPGSSSGGGESSGSGEMNTTRTLNIAATQDSGTLDPLGVTGGFVSVLYAFYEPLYDTRADGSRIWVLGTALDRVSDLEYTLKIREGVTFSNGNPMTADDVLYSMELCAANPQFSLNVKVVDFEKTKVIDDYTIDLWYTEYNASQEPGLASLLIVDKESYDAEKSSQEPIGTGPYTVTDYVVNSHLSVTAREDYWNGTPKIKNINFKVINEPAQIINALETGDVDMAGVSVADVDYVKKLGYDVEIRNGGYNYSAFYSMLPGNPLASKEARWAVSMAIDRQSIADIIFSGQSTVTDYPGSHAMIDLEDRYLNLHETYSTGYNPERAKELADQSGLTGQTVRIITNGSSDPNTIAEMIQANLLDIGVNAQIVNYDQATYFGVLMDASNFEIAVFTPSAPSMLAVDVLSMYLTFIPLGWEGPERDHYGELSMGAIGTYDAKERGELLFQALEVFEDFDPWFGLFEYVSSFAQSSDLTGVEYMIAGSLYYNNIAFK